MHPKNCKCTRCNKARGCQIVSAAGTRYRVRSITGKLYTVVKQPDNVYTCSCSCGKRKRNSTCAHAQKVRWEN